MKSNLAYIDAVMDTAIANENIKPTVADKDRQDAEKKGRKIIGGFRVKDPTAEQQAIDNVIAKRRALIDKFMQDRAMVREKLLKLGVTPLAVCPTGAWYKICRETDLFILNPDKDGRVGYARDAFKTYSEKTVDKTAEANWLAFLKNLFPDNRSVTSSDVKATLVLPDPPADVAETLCKVQGLTLTVAAVGDAIKILEKPSDLMKNAKSHPKDLWAQQQGYDDYADWLKRDPIIFTEEGSATAIIAQFGDFPIEQAVVDAAINANTLLVDKPQEAKRVTSASAFADPEDNYLEAIRQRYMQQAMLWADAPDRAQQRFERQRREMEARARQALDSRSWTG